MTKIKKKMRSAESKIKGKAGLNSCNLGDMKYHNAVTKTIKIRRLMAENHKKYALETGLLFGIIKFFSD